MAKASQIHVNQDGKEKKNVAMLTPYKEPSRQREAERSRDGNRLSPSEVHKSSSVAGHVIQTVGHICRLRCQLCGSLYQGVIRFQHKYFLMNFCFSYVCACVY